MAVVAPVPLLLNAANMPSTYRVQVPLLPGRSQPAHSAEMSTQFLFGEWVECLENQGDWWLVERKEEKYPAWVRNSGLVALLGAEAPGHFQQTLIQQSVGDFGRVWTSMGSKIKGEIQVPAALPEWAECWLGVPYLWGGKSAMGIDCSGLSQLFWESRGLMLPRDAAQQAEVGALVAWLFESKPGDLVFFDNDQGRIVHVGILLSAHQVLHAAGMVRIDKIDQQGIFRADEGRYSHALRLIRRPGS